jgi:hypothetical protein
MGQNVVSNVRKLKADVKFEVFTAVKIQVAVFCVVTQSSGLAGYQCFGGPRCLHLKGEVRMKTARYPAIPLHDVTTQSTAT